MLLIAQSIWTYNDYLSLQSPVQTITYFKNLSQYILSLSDLHADNAFIQKGIQSERKYYNTLADPNFTGEDLQTAFRRIDESLTSLNQWLKALRESFRQRRPIPVEELRK